MVSDDLIVPEEFLATHIQTLEQFPNAWVVGGIQQMEALSATPFGRYLEALEESWEEARKTTLVGPRIWELSWPTARNLSLPRADLERTGLFDEQFRMACEDQDLAHQARAAGIRFLYNTNITCLHNDCDGDLKRFCHVQENRMHDTVLFCNKWKEVHGNAPITRLNGYLHFKDGPILVARKIVKLILATRPLTYCLEMSISMAERIRLPDRILWRLYRLLVGTYQFRGWREGLWLWEQKAR
jgi:GT2 family glycosyltransferase